MKSSGQVSVLVINPWFDCDKGSLRKISKVSKSVFQKVNWPPLLRLLLLQFVLVGSLLLNFPLLLVVFFLASLQPVLILNVGFVVKLIEFFFALILVVVGIVISTVISNVKISLPDVQFFFTLRIFNSMLVVLFNLFQLFVIVWELSKADILLLSNHADME